MGVESAGLSRLARFMERVPAGTQIYDQGEVPDRIVIVLRGRLQFEVVGEDGDIAIVGEVAPGQMAGHVAAVNAHPTSAAARAVEDTILLSIPMGELAEAIQDSPGLATELREALETARQSGRAGAFRRWGGGTGRAPVSIPLQRLVDDEFFFVDNAECPVCDTPFEYLRIRTRGLRPGQRDSDLYVSYIGNDPTWYALVACPICSYTSYHDDFSALEAEERKRLVAGTEQRRSMMAKPLTGHRTAEDAESVLELAMECYALRHPNGRRHAVLLHRRAWLARAKGDKQAEVLWLERARDAYQDAYERDPDVSEEGALRAAYLIGDLTLRLGDPHSASRWLEICAKNTSKEHSGLVRMARERLFDAREAAKAQSDIAREAS